MGQIGVPTFSTRVDIPCHAGKRAVSDLSEIRPGSFFPSVLDSKLTERGPVWSAAGGGNVCMPAVVGALPSAVRGGEFLG